MENVSNLLNGNGGEWMRAVLTALAEIGYDAEWDIIRASDVGALHRRARVWIVAYPQHNEHIGEKPRKPQEKRGSQGKNRQDNGRARESCGANELDRGQEKTGADCKNRDKTTYPNPDMCGRLHGGHEKQSAEARVNAQCESAGLCEDVADSKRNGLQRVGEKRETSGQAGLCHGKGTNKKENMDNPGGRRYEPQERQIQAGGNGSFNAGRWPAEPNVGRVANGIPSRVDRLKCLGNAVVPQCVELVGRMILKSGLLKGENN
jgi:DNA (cytosine-5)-methyltransferase 1